ncbi:acetyl-CoA carboxylase biotin carboxyl carrier protein [Candidatus Saganbacteria bacterium]|nr:acetyl-CoA carboxylase biotin carboxyl carrier protein [Candidatus Saganbacteria bacterium]
MVDWELVEKLIKTVKEAGISGLAVEEKGVKYEVRSEGGQITAHPTVISAPAHQTVHASAKVESETMAEEADVVAITSPMVGTFYRSPSPESPPFVAVGDTIASSKPVCIIEAMKLFNEIEAEVSGKIIKILVENGQPVEYGQKLMLVKKG